MFGWVYWQPGSWNLFSLSFVSLYVILFEPNKYLLLLLLLMLLNFPKIGDCQPQLCTIGRKFSDGLKFSPLPRHVVLLHTSNWLVVWVKLERYVSGPVSTYYVAFRLAVYMQNLVISIESPFLHWQRCAWRKRLLTGRPARGAASHK